MSKVSPVAPDTVGAGVVTEKATLPPPPLLLYPVCRRLNVTRSPGCVSRTVCSQGPSLAKTAVTEAPANTLPVAEPLSSVVMVVIDPLGFSSSTSMPLAGTPLLGS